MNLGNTIKNVRVKLGISQKDLAEKCKMSPAYLWEIENNEKEPSIGKLKIIANALNMPLPVLFFLSFDYDDIKPEKREAVALLETSIRGLMTDLFLNYPLVNDK